MTRKLKLKLKVIFILLLLYVICILTLPLNNVTYAEDYFIYYFEHQLPDTIIISETTQHYSIIKEEVLKQSELDNLKEFISNQLKTSDINSEINVELEKVEENVEEKIKNVEKVENQLVIKTLSTSTENNNKSSKKKKFNSKKEILEYFLNNSKDRDLLYRLVDSEGGIDSYEGKINIADVVVERMLDVGFPDTPYDVIYEPGQFEVVKNGTINNPASKKSIQAVDDYLNERIQPMYPGATFFNTKKLDGESYASQTQKKRGQSEKHFFYGYAKYN